MKKTLFKVILLFLISFTAPHAIFAGSLMGVHVQEKGLASFKGNMDKANQIGLKVIRIPVDWNQLESSQANYSVNYINEIKGRVEHAQVNGQKVVMMLGQSPAWANGGRDPAFPPSFQFFQHYANAMANLHSELMDQWDSFIIDAQTVLAWEVWNEPNVLEFWRPDGNPRTGSYVLMPLGNDPAVEEYASLLSTTYDEMKWVHPGVTILGGSLASGDTEYLERMLQYFEYEGNGVKFDHLSLHPYSGPGSNDTVTARACTSEVPSWCYKAGTEAISAILNEYGVSNEIWFTEFGLTSGALPGRDYELGEGVQAQYVDEALQVLKEWNEEGNINIPVAILYFLQDAPGDKYGLYDINLNEKQVVNVIRSKVDTSSGRLITVEQPVIGAPNLLSPVDITVAEGSQKFQWDEVVGASSYFVWVNNYGSSGTDNNGIVQQTYLPSICVGGVCTATPSAYFQAGSGHWWVTANFSSGEQMTSEGQFPIVPLVSPNLISPVNQQTVSSGNQTFQWGKVNGAVSYLVYANNYASNNVDYNGIVNSFVSPASCSGSVCTLTLNAYFQPGYAQWWVTAIFANEVHSESQAGDFVVNN